jgi:hypothetical protein
MSVIKPIWSAILGICLGFHAQAFETAAVGSVIPNPVTLAAEDLDGLIAKVADGINPSQIVKHGGHFETYFLLAEDQRAGKVFEALVADRVNKVLLPKGRAMLVTAAEGNRKSAADAMLSIKTKAGYVVDELYQFKLGYQNAVSALTDARYAGMKIITTRDVYDGMLEKVRRESIKKASLVREISPDTARLKDALDSGRICKELPGGVPLPTREEVKAISRGWYSARWDKIKTRIVGQPVSMAKTLAPVSTIVMDAERTAAYVGAEILAANEAASAAKTGSLISKMNPLALVPARVWLELGRGASLLDAAFTTHSLVTDYERWQSGSMASDEYAAMSSIKVIKLWLSTAAITDPELFSKFGFVAAYIVLSCVEYGGEWIFAGRQEELRVELMSLETEERYRMALQMVLGN